MASLTAVAALLVFLLVVISVIVLVTFPVTLPLPACCAKERVTLSYACAPPIGVALMLTLDCMSVNDVITGIAGTDSIAPYGILILFMSLAYVSNSLDMTGVFAW
jgi:hypothetical protein